MHGHWGLFRIYRTVYEPAILMQTVFERVRLKGPWIQETVHVSVQVASVGTTVKVSAPCKVFIFPGCSCLKSTPVE